MKKLAIFFVFAMFLPQPLAVNADSDWETLCSKKEHRPAPTLPDNWREKISDIVSEALAEMNDLEQQHKDLVIEIKDDSFQQKVLSTVNVLKTTSTVNLSAAEYLLDEDSREAESKLLLGLDLLQQLHCSLITLQNSMRKKDLIPQITPPTQVPPPLP